MYCGTLCKSEENALAVIDFEALERVPEEGSGEPVFLKVSRSKDSGKNRVILSRGQS